MEKWADFLISAVRYDADHKHITHVRVHDVNWRANLTHFGV
jgi:hypothetical protein